MPIERRWELSVETLTNDLLVVVTVVFGALGIVHSGIAW